VGDWRIICEIQDAKLVILALRVGHRREVYQTLEWFWRVTLTPVKISNPRQVGGRPNSGFSELERGATVGENIMRCVSLWLEPGWGSGFGARIRSRRAIKDRREWPTAQIREIRDFRHLREINIPHPRRFDRTSKSRFCCCPLTRAYSLLQPCRWPRGDNANDLLLLIASNCIHYEKRHAAGNPNRNVSLAPRHCVSRRSGRRYWDHKDQGCGLETHPMVANIR